VNSLPDEQRCQLRNEGNEEAAPTRNERADDQRENCKIADDRIEKRRPAVGIREMLSGLSPFAEGGEATQLL
jgi:hypothetical protein